MAFQADGFAFTLGAGAGSAHRVARAHISEAISLSPDAREIAYGITGGEGGAGEIRTIGTDGEPGSSVKGTGVSDDPAWSPDGTRITFDDGKALRLYDLRTRTISRVNTPPGPCVDSTPAWRADSAAIAFYRDCDVGRGSGIFTVTPDGAAPTRILKGGGDSLPDWPGAAGLRRGPGGLTWSPDGRSIAFEMGDGSVWLTSTMGHMPRPGHDLRRLVPPGPSSTGNGMLAWSPNGKAIAFCEAGAVYLVDPVSGRLTKLAGAPAIAPYSISWVAATS